MITLRRNPQDRLLELGGGANPQVVPTCRGGQDVAIDVRICNNANGEQVTDFACDFNNPLPIKDEDFDGVFSMFAVEHVSWRNVKQLIGEIFRVLKPGGKATLVVPNTEEQLKWIQSHPDGWDGKDAFESCSCILYGDNDYVENSHRSYFSPLIMTDLLRNAGFDDVVIQAYGERGTDMCCQATKKGTPNAAVAAPVGPRDLLSGNPTVVLCGATNPQGVVCQLEKGHQGKHKGTAS